MDAEILIAGAALVLTFMGWLTTWANESNDDKNNNSL